MWTCGAALQSHGAPGEAVWVYASSWRCELKEMPEMEGIIADTSAVPLLSLSVFPIEIVVPSCEMISRFPGVYLPHDVLEPSRVTKLINVHAGSP